MKSTKIFRLLAASCLIFFSISLYAQSTIITLKSENIKDKSSFANGLKKHLKEYQIVNINLTDDMVSRLQEESSETLLLEIAERTIAFNKFELYSSNSTSTRAITYESGNNENLTINNDFINGTYRKGKEIFAIQPLRDFVKDANKSLFVTYKPTDIINKNDHICTVNEVSSRGKSINSKMSASSCERIRLAIANDFSMFQRYGSVSGVMNHNTAVINNIRSLFRSNFSSVIEFEIVESFIPVTSSQDPFISSLDAGVLLGNFTSWAQMIGNPWSNLDFDMGELWTSRDIAYQGNSGTAGLADRPNSTSPYSQVFHILEDFSSLQISLANLTAHEMGHNFSAVHDPNGSFTIMVGQVPNDPVGWSGISIADINQRLTTIGQNLLNCSCGETFLGPSLLCTGNSDNLSVTITEGVGPYTLIYNDGSTSTTINNYTSGDLISINPTTTTIYTIETIEDVGAGGLDFICGSNMSITVQVFDEAGTASANGQQSSYDVTQCDVAETISLTTDISMLGQDQVIGWWVSEDQPIINTLNNSNLASALSSASLGGPLSNPVNHIYESTGGNPINDFNLNFNCGALNDDKDYYVTPFVSNKKTAIADIDCSVSGAVFPGTAIFNGVPAKFAQFNSNNVCRPANPINPPVFSYKIEISGYTGNVNEHYFIVVDPANSSWIGLDGDGSYTFPQSIFNFPTDPGLQSFDLWVWENGGSGMENATISATLEITYPGAPAIIFPDVTNVNTCSFGAPVMLNCDCPLPPCTTTASVIDNTNANDGTIVTSANQLSTSGITNITTTSSSWQAQIEVILNGDFSVGGGSTLCIDIGPCE